MSQNETAPGPRARAKRPPAGARGAQSVRKKVADRQAELAAGAEGGRTAILVMRTSRYLGTDGKPVARSRVAAATPAFAEKLLAAGEAREATAAELRAAEAGRGVLQLVG